MPPKKRKIVFNDNTTEKSCKQYSYRDSLEKFTVYAAAKMKTAPWSSLKSFLQNRGEYGSQQKFPKLGRPFALTVELEQQLVRYVNDMQELGFGLTVVQVRKIAEDEDLYMCDICIQNESDSN